jgi:hypothetical protein
MPGVQEGRASVAVRFGRSETLKYPVPTARDDDLDLGHAGASGLQPFRRSARVKARRENAEAYGRWLAGQTEAEKTETADLDRIDNATRDAALSGAEW